MASAADGQTTAWVQDVARIAAGAGGDDGWTGDAVPVRRDSRLAQVQGDDAGWFLGDALGSVRQLVDDDGAVVLARDYDPYGQMVSADGTGSSGYGFTGEQYDRYTQFVFLRARWLTPGLGGSSARILGR